MNVYYEQKIYTMCGVGDLSVSFRISMIFIGLYMYLYLYWNTFNACECVRVYVGALVYSRALVILLYTPMYICMCVQ